MVLDPSVLFVLGGSKVCCGIPIWKSKEIISENCFLFWVKNKKCLQAINTFLTGKIKSFRKRHCSNWRTCSWSLELEHTNCSAFPASSHLTAATHCAWQPSDYFLRALPPGLEMTAPFLFSWKEKGIFEDLEWEDRCGGQGSRFAGSGVGSKSSMACPYRIVLLLWLVGAKNKWPRNVLMLSS